MHPSWSGQLQISLVSFGVKFFPATSALSQVSFHEIDRESGERVRRLSVVENSRPIERAQVVKGYEYAKNKYVTFEPGEIDAVRIPSKHSLEIKQFVPATDIDPAYFDRPYFVVPADEHQAQAYVVVREAMRELEKAGLGEVSFDRREHLVAILPQKGEHARGLMAYTLRYAAELRGPDEAFASIPSVAIDPEQLSLAEELIRRNTHEFRPAEFADDYEAALHELIDAKLKHVPLPKEEPVVSKGKMIDLMDALRRSVEGEGKPARKPVRRADAEPAAKPAAKSSAPRKKPAVATINARSRKTA